jgi:hypothetical protein
MVEVTPTLINAGFKFPGGQFAPGTISLIAPDGSARWVAEGIAFTNGMAVSSDNSTLIVAESYGKGSPRSTSRRMAAYPTGAFGRILATVCPTAFAWTRRVRSGTRMFRTNVACESAKAVRSCKPLLLTAAVSLVCLAASRTQLCFWLLRSGVA